MSTCLDPHAHRNRWAPIAPPSPVKLKASALPPTDAQWTLIGWHEGDCFIFHPTVPLSVVPGESLFRSMLADHLERETGESMFGVPLEVSCVTVLKGKAVQA